MQPQSGRIQSIDAFRGFALAGIAVAHMVEQYYGALPPEGLFAGVNASLLDQVAGAFMDILVRGKFFALFSFLFGVSFFIQMDNAAQKGVNFRVRFLWRLALLFAIGYAHALFYRGDILTIYATIGVLLVLFFNVRTSICLGIAAAIFLGLPRYLLFAMYGGEPVIPGGAEDPTLPFNVAYTNALLHGSAYDVFAANAWDGLLSKAEFQVNVFGRAYQTFAYFLVGMCVGRLQLFRDPERFRPALKRLLRYSLLATIVFFVAVGYLFMSAPEGGEFNNWHMMFALTAMDLWNLALATVYLAAFLLIFVRPTGGRVLGKLAPYGRTALTNYVLQTLIGTAILYNFGLGLIGTLSNADMFGLAIVLITIQVALSTLWLRHFRYGPLEWLWRSGTWLKWQPLRR